MYTHFSGVRGGVGKGGEVTWLGGGEVGEADRGLGEPVSLSLVLQLTFMFILLLDSGLLLAVPFTTSDSLQNTKVNIV